jgi:hypothetical protein
MSGERVVPEPILTPNGWENLTANDLAQFALFDIQLAAELVQERYARPKKMISTDELGVLRLPYPAVWMEWTAQSEQPYNIAVLAYTPKGREEGTEIELAVFMGIDKVVACGVGCLIQLDEHGHGVSGTERWRVAVPDQDHPRFHEYTKFVSDQIITALMALSLINCRNVGTEDRGRIQIARSGAQKRRREPVKSTRYRTIKLPGGGTHYDSATGTHRPTALHRVRGHFKTFTAERPLLGRHVGTFWWGWSVRGDAEYGEVVSDYQLGKDKT